MSRSPGRADEWRTEYWHDMRVEVPADWGYGGAPMDWEARPTTAACWPIAMVTADGQRLKRDDPTMPYVGRPIALTDLCQPYPFRDAAAPTPKAPYVWLGAAVEPGHVDLGDGWVQETVEVNGSTLTVATDDPALRTRILDIGRRGRDLHGQRRAEATSDVFPRYEPGDPDDVERMAVCAYRLRDREACRRGRRPDLCHHGRRGRGARVPRRDGRGRARPRPVPDGELHGVRMGRRSSSRAVTATTLRRDVVHLVCPGVDVDGSTLKEFRTVKLTPDMVRPWAVGGIPAVVYGPNGGKGAMIESFIGPLG